MTFKHIGWAMALCAALASCSTTAGDLQGLTPAYQLSINQGHELEPEAIAALRPGMTKSEVRVLLGTPLLQDPFHADRWDYPYYYMSRGSVKQQDRLILHFDPAGRLASIEGDAYPKAMREAERRRNAGPVDAAPAQRRSAGQTGGPLSRYLGLGGQRPR